MITTPPKSVTPHKYAEAISAWAYGYPIFYRYKGSDEDWRECPTPSQGRPNFENEDLEFMVPHHQKQGWLNEAIHIITNGDTNANTAAMLLIAVTQFQKRFDPWPYPGTVEQREAIEVVLKERSYDIGNRTNIGIARCGWEACLRQLK